MISEDQDRVGNGISLIFFFLCKCVEGIFVSVLGMVSILGLRYLGCFSPSHQISKRVLPTAVWETSAAAAALSAPA